MSRISLYLLLLLLPQNLANEPISQYSAALTVHLPQLQEEERVPEICGDAAARHQRRHHLPQRGQVHAAQDHRQVRLEIARSGRLRALA